MAVTCINPTIDIMRYSNAGARMENYSYSEVTYLSFRSLRKGGCADAQFVVNRALNEIGSLKKGDRITIEYKGTRCWYGWVQDYVSRNGTLEIECIGTWAALGNVLPDNFIYGTECDYAVADSQNEYSDLATAQEILEDLYDKYLGSSTITKTSLAAASPTYQEPRLDCNGVASLAQIADQLASNAGNWSVGIDENMDFYLNDPASYSVTDFRACTDATYEITDIEKEDSIKWTDYPTVITINGDGGYTETFKASDFGYSPNLVNIAGITMSNALTISLPSVRETETTSYTSLVDTDVTVRSVSAARHADSIFSQTNYETPERFAVACSQVNTLFFPWDDKVRIFDPMGQSQGTFLIESLEYESQDSNLNIREMLVKRV